MEIDYSRINKQVKAIESLKPSSLYMPIEETFSEIYAKAVWRLFGLLRVDEETEEDGSKTGFLRFNPKRLNSRSHLKKMDAIGVRYYKYNRIIESRDLNQGVLHLDGCSIFFDIYFMDAAPNDLGKCENSLPISLLDFNFWEEIYDVMRREYNEQKRKGKKVIQAEVDAANKIILDSL